MLLILRIKLEKEQEMQKERNIVEGKYPKNCWNKIILMLGINLLFVMCVHKTSERYEDMFVDSTWQSPFVAMNIEYKDSVYSIVPREGDMYLFLNDGVANKKYRYSNFIRTDIGYRQHYILFTKGNGLYGNSTAIHRFNL